MTQFIHKNLPTRAKSKKEAGKNLHSWAFYQLKEMIQYKAEMVGGDKMVNHSLKVGIGLQVFFFILFFGAILPKLNNVLGAMLCLVIGLFSLLIGIQSMKKIKSFPSVIVTMISVLILVFTIFAYFMGEGGYPPGILQ